MVPPPPPPPAAATRPLLRLLGAHASAAERLAILTEEVAPAALVRTAAAEFLDGHLASVVLGAARTEPAVAERWQAERAALTAAYHRAHAGHALFRREAAFVFETLQAAGVRVVPIKGIFVAERCYPEPAVRVLSDIDVLVDDVDRAAAALVRRGASYGARPAAVRAWQRQAGHEVALGLPPRGQTLVELHWRLYPEQHAEAARALLAAARPGRCAGVAVPVPQDADQFLVSAHHLVTMFGGEMPLLRWWLDLERLTPLVGPFPTLIARAAAWNDLLPLAIAGLGLAELCAHPWGADADRLLADRLTRPERQVLLKARRQGVYALTRADVLGALWRGRPGGWRSRSLLRYLWPPPGEVAARYGVAPDAPRFFAARLRFSLARLGQALRQAGRLFGRGR